jgi:hypothetical protein
MNQVTTSDGIIYALLVPGPCVSILIEPRWSVTVALALEDSRSVSADIVAIERISTAIKDRSEDLRHCAAI